MTQVRTLSTQRLGARLGRLHDDDLQEIVDGLLQVIG
jgi:mRNA-degrading endonuclease toxin of MazEF toxin-antitoxin module